MAEFIHHWFRVWIVGDAGGPQMHVPGLVAERECLRVMDRGDWSVITIRVVIGYSSAAWVCERGE